MAAGAGETVADFGHPEPVPPPLTTIAWRMASHLDRRARHARRQPLRRARHRRVRHHRLAAHRRRRPATARPSLRGVDHGRAVARRRRSAPAVWTLGGSVRGLPDGLAGPAHLTRGDPSRLGAVPPARPLPNQQRRNRMEHPHDRQDPDRHRQRRPARPQRLLGRDRRVRQGGPPRPDRGTAGGRSPVGRRHDHPQRPTGVQGRGRLRRSRWSRACACCSRPCPRARR